MSHRALRMLIVGTDPSVAGELRAMLIKARYDVVLVATEPEAVAADALIPFRLLIVELTSGAKDQSPVPRLKEQCPEIPMLVVCRADESAEAKETLQRQQGSEFELVVPGQTLFTEAMRLLAVPAPKA